MRVTRSAALAAANGIATAVETATKTAEKVATAGERKRKAELPEKQTTKKQRANGKATNGEGKKSATQVSSNIVVPKALATNSGTSSAPTFLPATLSFSYHEAKNHLIEADPRFEDIFNKMKCRPYEHLERVDPFRTLVCSILGQQISWMAARSITHKFKRLYNPLLPEKPTDVSMNDDSFFPTAEQVCGTEIPTLRTAGLSGRKAEYVLDLASRFADGRLSAAKIMEATDEELAEMLIAVRGIGRWTVDMFAIFSLRRPDILPVGDLGVQRGVIRWFLSLHSPKHTFTLSPKKLPKAPSPEPDEGDVNAATSNPANVPVRAQTPDASSVLPAPITPKQSAVGDDAEVQSPSVSSGPPEAFTPSINRTLNKTLPGEYKPPPLPASLTVQSLQARLNGKNKVKGSMLTPTEMEELTEGWRPYRSLGVYYMWALAEEKSG